ncbi:hypothetical protein N6H14_03725 [Paenibacillus sp. CC-CFT747]|nr:hypothetical protein N6H14_03725 [Paenibacillus sp. CC-CFT747]
MDGRPPVPDPGNTLNLSFISLFSTVLIMLMCFVSINYTVQFQAVGQNLPNDVAFEAQDPALPDRLALLMEEEGHPVKKHRTLEALETEPVTSLDTAFENPEYYLPKVLLVSQSAYNEIAAMRGDGQSVQLQGKQAAALAQGSNFPQRYPSGGEPPFRVNAQTETSFTLVEKKDYALLGWATDPASSMLKKPAVLVVSDEAYRELAGQALHRTFHLYQIGNAKGAEKLSEKLHAAVTETPGAYYSSFADVYSRQIEGSSLMLFSGAFLALIALFALASVIYFKQLREATEARPSFTILRKMGVERRQMKSVIRKQLLFVFLPPLALGLMNSGLIIKTYIVDSVKDYPNISALVWGTLGAYFLLYALLYLSSSSLYYKIASGRTT